MKHLLYLPILCFSMAFSLETITFEYTGGEQIYTTPAGLTNITIEVWGAQGGANPLGVNGGLGGYAIGEFASTSEETLFVYVGGNNGFNGGGSDGIISGCNNANGGNGGGASDIRVGGTTLSNRVIVAAGGGGAAGNRVSGCGRGAGGGGGGGYFGAGGGACFPNFGAMAGGGTQGAGGSNGTSTSNSSYNGTPGSFGIGGNGGGASYSGQQGNNTGITGGVGGGITGGPGAYAGNWTGGSGGGGSSYVGGVENGYTESGVNEGHGLVVITILTVPLISIPHSANYSDVPFNNTYDMTFELIHYNETPTIIDSIKIGFEEGSTNETPQFQVIGSDSFTVEPDSTYNLTIRYFPHLNELYTQDLSGITPSVWFYNESEAEQPIFNGLSLSANSFVNLSASPGDHTFTDIPLGTFLEQDIDFTNTSDAVQEITDVLPGYFDYSDSSFVELSEFTIVNETEFELNPGESQIITLRYSPEDVGTDDAFLYSFGPDYIHHIMPIAGSGILPTVTITPESLDFGNVQVGAYSDQLISITPDISVGEINIVDINSSSSVFTVVSDTSFSVLPEEVIPITVRFTPTDIDSTYSAELSLLTSVGDSTIILGTSTLIGNGTSESANSFYLISPMSTTGVSVHTQFQWLDAFNGATGNYRLRYGYSPDVYTDGLDTYIEVNGITDIKYYVENDLPIGSQLYWMVWAIPADGEIQPALQSGFFTVETELPELNGPIPGPRTLLPENSPYIVKGDVQVLETNNLTIPAGIEILFEDNYGFEISGDLVVNGTEESGVVFKSRYDTGPGSWKEIRFTNTAINLVLDDDNNVLAGSQFHYMTIQDAGSNNLPALDGYWDGRSVTKSLLLENCNINNNAGPGVRSGHLSRLINNTIESNNGYGINGGAYFEGNTIDTNQGYGINTLDGQIFSGNTITNNNGDGIVTGLGELFEYNLIDGNTGNGITTDLGGTFANNTIQNNSGYGIYAGLGEVFSFNIILDNGSYGIKTEAGESFTDNIVSGNNGFGIETTTAYSSGTITFSGNQVQSNTGENGDFDGGILTSILAEFTDNVVSGNTGYGITGGHSFSADSVLNNSSYGIHTGGGDSFINTVVNNNGGYGIYTGTGNTFSNNDISANTGYGLHSDAGDTFENNTVNDNGAYGIYSGAGHTFRLNTVSSNGDYGINTVSGNSFENNTVTSNTGYGINTDAGDSFTGNTVTENGGFGIDTDSGNTFANNTVSENGSWGINTDAGDTFDSNTVENNTSYGINTDTGNTFTDNIVSGNGGYGINTDTGDSFTNNNVENNGSFGIDTDTGNTFYGNNVNGNGDFGINTDTGHTFDQNTIEDNNGYGINTDSGIVFTGNVISGNGEYGLNISPGDSSIVLSGNTFESNTDNGLQAFITTDISLIGEVFTANHNNGIEIDGSSVVSIIASNIWGDGALNHGGSTPDGNNENGLRITNVGSFSISSSSISNNWASGLYIQDTDSITISDNTFTENDWSAIRQINGLSSTINNNIFSSNQNNSQNNSNSGGAIYTDMPEVQILSNEFEDNVATYGGAIYINSDSPYVYDNLLSNNNSHLSGGAIYIGGSDSPVIKYNTITGDISNNNEGGAVFIANTGSSRTVINENILSDHFGHAVFGNPDSLMYNNITGNMDTDGNPGFSLRKTNLTDMVGTADQNWWGTTSNANISEMIWDGFDDGDNLGYVTINSSLPWPSPDAPGQVADAISIQLYEDENYEEVLTYSPGMGATLFIELEAVDENPFSADQTPISVTNINGFSLFDILASETDINSGIFRGNIEVQEFSNPFEGVIGAAIGDTLKVYSTVDPEVELFVTIAGPADAALSDNQLNFTQSPYSMSDSAMVTIYNVGTGYMNADVVATESWIFTSVDHFELVPGDSASFSIAVNSSGIANGEHLGAMQIVYDEEIDNINVSMTVQNIIYVENQQIESGTFNAVPLMLDLNDGEEVSGLIFAIEVSPVDAPELLDDLQIELVANSISTPLVNVIEPGLISVVILDIDNPLSGLGVNFANLLITLPPNAVSFETYNLSISGASASDAEYNVIELASPDTAELEVFITNDPPYFSPSFTNIDVVEGDSITIAFDIIDPEGTDVAIELIESADYVLLNHPDGDTSGTIAISPAFGDISSGVLLHATDSGNPPVTGADSFMVFINHYPDWDAPPSMQVLAGDSVSIPISTSDIDLDNVTLTLDAENSPDYAVWDAGTSTLTLQTTEGALDGTVIFTLADDGNPVASKDVSIAVDILHLPILSPIENQSINEDDTLIVSISATDADGDALSITVVSDNGNVSVSLDSSAVIAIPASNYFGTAEITVSVSDGTYTVEDSFTLTIDPVNDAPVAESGSYELDEDSSIEFTLNASDVDSEELDFAILSGPYHGSLDTLEGSFSYIPDSNFNGGDSLTFEVSDGELTGTGVVSFNVLSQNDPPIISGMGENFHIPENDTLEVEIGFTDIDGDSLTIELTVPSYCEASQSENQFSLSCEPDSNDESENLSLSVSDGDTTVSASVNVLIYNTYLVGDVRPAGGDAAGEFGDDMVVAPDVINALKVSTEAPGTEIPDSTSNLFDAFDSSPMEVDSLDVNGDGDFYDEGERGGDGNIEVADIIVSLNRATLIPGYPNVRRVDNNYPYSSRFYRNSRSQDPTDMIVLGSITAIPGETAQIPVTLIRGESEFSLTSLVIGFAVTYANDVELAQPLSFTADIDCYPLSVPTNNHFLSLLLMNIDGQNPESELLLGHVAFTIPEYAVEGDIFTLSTQRESGSTSSYQSILFLEGTASTVTITASSVSGDINFDGTVNVQDILLMVNIIIQFEEEYSDETLAAADINGDGFINILDILRVVNIILPDDMAREKPAHETTLYYGSNTVIYKANGAVAGFQLEIAGEYEITNSTLPEGWEMHYNDGTIVLFSMDGSSLESNTLFEYTGNMTIESVIVSDIEGNSIPASSVIVPSKYALESAYPNPFNPVTTLNFSLPESQEVMLQVYNLQGRVIETLVNSNIEAGYHSVQWNADNYSSGMYFVKMVAGEYVNTQKLMLVK